MRTLRTNIGLTATLALCAGVMLVGTKTTLAATSASYILESDSAAATTQVGVSASFTMNESEVTWVRLPATSTSFQIVPVLNATSSASSASSVTTTNEQSGTPKKSGNRRPRVIIPGRYPVSREETETQHAAASSEMSTTDETSSVVAKEVTEMKEATLSSSLAAEKTGVVHQSTGDCSMRFFDLTDAQSKDDSVGIISLLVLFILQLLSLLTICLLVASMQLKKVRRMNAAKQHKTCAQKHWKTALSILLAAFGLATLLFVSFVTVASAAQTVPTKHVYNGRLLDSAGSAITTAHTIRFSYWKSTDALAGDTTGTGSINTGAANYANWQEVHTVTPNSLGYFSVELGSVTALPTFANLPVSTLLSLFLQVDVKTASAANTAYEMLDIDPSDTTIDRSGILSVPFASNADTIDQREIGTASGSIAVLGPNGQFSKSTTPGGTNSGSFVIDADSTETSTIALQFGGTLAKKLTYDVVNSTFRFNANLEVQGNLTVTGLINGINVTQLQSSTGALKAWSGGGLNLNVAYGSYRLNGNVTNYGGGQIVLAANATNYIFFGSGGLTTHTSSFPTDESFIPLAQVTTSAGSILSVLDRRSLSSDDRERTVVQTFNPSYEKASYQGDGVNNVGQLAVLYDTGSLRNYYNWTSTRSNLQDYDILLRVPVTDDFVRFKATNPISLTYRSSSANAADNKLDVQIYDTNGNAVTFAETATGLANTSWTTTTLNFTGAPVWTPGQDMLIKLKVSAKNAASVHIGGLKLSTVELLKE